VVGVTTNHLYLTQRHSHYSYCKRFFGIVNEGSFAEAIVFLLLMFFSSLFVLIQKVTKKSRLHNQGYSGFCSATTKKSKAWL